VPQDLAGIGGDDPLGKRRGLCQQEPGPVGQRRAGGHTLELVDGGHDVEEGRPRHSLRMVERQPKRDAGAAIMAYDREPVVSAAGHELDELGSQLSLRISLPLRPAGRSTRLPVTAKVGDHHAVAPAEPWRTAISRQHRWVSGKPCSRTTGGPSPP
jgi:hypothetical protein